MNQIIYFNLFAILKLLKPLLKWSFKKHPHSVLLICLSSTISIWVWTLHASTKTILHTIQLRIWLNISIRICLNAVRYAAWIIIVYRGRCFQFAIQITRVDCLIRLGLDPVRWLAISQVSIKNLLVIQFYF